MFFINKSKVPADRWRDITYGRVVVNYRPEKDDPYQTRLTVGGDRVNYPDDCGTPTVDLLTVKLLLNSVVSTPNAKFMTIDVKDFYLNTPMPADFVKQYDLAAKVTGDGYVYVKIRRGMYGLPLSGLLAHKLLEKRLNKEGYRQSELTPGFWTHDWRPISFTLCVNNFGAKYVGQEHADHLMTVLKKNYAISSDDKGKRYLGLDFSSDDKGRRYLGLESKLGLRKPYCAHLHARLCHRCPQTLSPHPTTQSPRSAACSPQDNLQRQEAVLKKR